MLAEVVWTVSSGRRMPTWRKITPHGQSNHLKGRTLCHWSAC